MDKPRYGTHPPEELPLVQLGAGSSVRLVAGRIGDAAGPARFAADVQIADYTLAPASSVEHALAAAHDNCLAYVYRGSATIGGSEVPRGSVVRLAPAAGSAERAFGISSGAEGAGVLVFCGKRLDQPIAWHGPFVMTTQAEIRTAISEYSAGTFLKHRAPWDYKRAAAAPAKV